MRKTVIYSVLVMILAVGFFFRLFYWEGLQGTDFAYHYVMVEQMLASGDLRPFNPYAHCGEGASALHPPGFYLLPYVLAKIIGLDAAFYLLSPLLGMLTILLTYILLSRVYNSKIGMLAAYFLAISFANISTMTHPNTYRGDVVVYPLLLLSLLFAYQFLTSRKQQLRNSALAGIFSGVPAFFWNGYSIVIVTYLGALSAVVIYRFFCNLNLSVDIKYSLLSLLFQACTVLLIHLSAPLYEKGKEFLFYYPFILLGVFVYYGAFFLTRRAKSLYPLAVVVVSSGIFLYFTSSYLKKLASGFGSISSELNLAPELFDTSTSIILLFHGATFLSCI